MPFSNPTLGVQCRDTDLTRNNRPTHRQRAAVWIVRDDLVLVMVWPHLILARRLAAAPTAWAHQWPSARLAGVVRAGAAVGCESQDLFATAFSSVQAWSIWSYSYVTISVVVIFSPLRA